MVSTSATSRMAVRSSPAVARMLGDLGVAERRCLALAGAKAPAHALERQAHRLCLGGVGQAGRAVQGGDGPDGLPDGGGLPPLCRERVHVGRHRLRCGGEGNKALGRGPAGEGQRSLAQGPLGFWRQCTLGVAGMLLQPRQDRLLGHGQGRGAPGRVGEVLGALRRLRASTGRSS